LNLSDIRRILAEGNLQLTKSLGQNFMHDGNQLRRIVKAAELKRNDKVLEIGPGLGPLTELLLEQVPEGEVLAIEKDARLAEILVRRFELDPQTGATPALPNAGRNPRENTTLRLIHDDALDYLRHEPRNWDGWKLVANLPYSVASPILVELALAPRGPDRLVATLQLEVARRLMAAPGKPEYGVLTLLIQLDYEPVAWFKVPASCFFPQPDVDSACVCLIRRGRPLLAPAHRETYVRIVKRSFSQRRKMMVKLLKEQWPAAAVDQAFSKIELSLSTRAESVTLRQFADLAPLLDGKTHE
jgi:16S rRNA (adenine1518-N6/adenine1519-N6)-dimethyltransferase